MVRRSWGRKIWWTAVAVVLLGLLLPVVVKLNYWQEEITAALAQGFGRPVRIGQVRLQLFGGPGFEIQDVVVGEDPRFGIEPFARIENLRARLHLRSVWQRRLQFSRLVLIRPSLNVVRNA